ncbi:MAG: hypothetical protein JWM59_2534 [Verrucomicrobiales bacterium]|nr:hypothetical protein [Verrucomicrobiales bacterium]
MRLQAEVIGRFEHAGDANRLLYTPIAQALTVRGTRRYLVDFTGDENALKAFLAKVLADPVSHELRTGEAPALSGHAFFLDYGMKAGALDHEKETILRLHRTSPAAGFEIQNLRINHRLYLFAAAGNPDTPALADRFVKDIVNPAIHTWQVTAA